jgi:hypothetical protein
MATRVRDEDKDREEVAAIEPESDTGVAGERLRKLL